MENINELVREKNIRQQEYSKTWSIRKFTNMSFGYVWGELFWRLPKGRKNTVFGLKNNRSGKGNNTWPIDRYIFGKSDLEQVNCLLYRFNYCSLFSCTMLSYNS